MLESGLGPVLALGLALELEPALGQVLAPGLELGPGLELEPALGPDSQ